MLTRSHGWLGSLCLGIAAANLARPGSLVLVAAGVPLVLLVAAGERAVTLALLLAVLGWWWGGLRLAALDGSRLTSRVGAAEDALVEVTTPPQRATFGIRAFARIRSFGAERVDEPVLLELPDARSPPLGGRLAVLAVVTQPRGPEHGFDERTWLRRHGVHVVLRVDRWRLVGRRGGFSGLTDSLHRRLGAVVGRGLRGERRALVEGVVLGEDQGIPKRIRDEFRVAGLYHLLAVSGQNVALVAGGALVLAWLLGVPRVVGEVGALASMSAYVLAVGPQPSVIRAGVAGALGSLAWITARQNDRWYALLLGALVLLAWNPYSLLDAGFQLSFAAVAAIFVLAPRLRRALDGYPIPARVADVVAISTACSLATAPVAWLDFHAIPLLGVPANLAAAPAVAPLLGCAAAAALLAPISAGAAAIAAQGSGLAAAYLAWCAHLVASVPGAQIRSLRAAAAVAALALLSAAYAWRCAERAEAGLPAHR